MFFTDSPTDFPLAKFSKKISAKSTASRSKIVISVPMTGTISFRTAFDLEYDNLPAEGASGLNTVTAIGLEYSF